MHRRSPGSRPPRRTRRPSNAAVAAGRVAPHGAEIEIRDDGAFVVATVRARATLLPLVELSAEAVAVKEPEQDSG